MFFSNEIVVGRQAFEATPRRHFWLLFACQHKIACARANDHAFTPHRGPPNLGKRTQELGNRSNHNHINIRLLPHRHSSRQLGGAGRLQQYMGATCGFCHRPRLPVPARD